MGVGGIGRPMVTAQLSYILQFHFRDLSSSLFSICNISLSIAHLAVDSEKRKRNSCCLQTSTNIMAQHARMGLRDNSGKKKLRKCRKCEVYFSDFMPSNFQIQFIIQYQVFDMDFKNYALYSHLIYPYLLKNIGIMQG